MEINLRFFKNIRLVFLLFAMFLLSIIKYIYLDNLEVFLIAAGIKIIVIAYISYSALVYLLEDIKLVNKVNSKGIYIILDKIDNQIIQYGLLFTILNLKGISVLIFLLLMALDFIISAKEALDVKAMIKFERLSNYCFYLALIIMVFIPTSILLLPTIFLKLLSVIEMNKR